MGKFLTKLQKEFRANEMFARTRSSSKWFMDRVKEMTTINRKNLLNDELLVNRKKPLIGRMFMYYYDPKTKDTLPYYDKFPLIFMVDEAENGFYGINIHYLDLKTRAKFFDTLLEFTNNNKFDETTKLRLSYDFLKQSAMLRQFRPCFKRYLSSNIKSNIAEVRASEWEMAVYLPTEFFAKSTKEQVWAQSKKLINK